VGVGIWRVSYSSQWIWCKIGCDPQRGALRQLRLTCCQGRFLLRRLTTLAKLGSSPVSLSSRRRREGNGRDVPRQRSDKPHDLGDSALDVTATWQLYPALSSSAHPVPVCHSQSSSARQRSRQPSAFGSVPICAFAFRSRRPAGVDRMRQACNRKRRPGRGLRWRSRAQTSDGALPAVNCTRDVNDCHSACSRAAMSSTPSATAKSAETCSGNPGQRTRPRRSPFALADRCRFRPPVSPKPCVNRSAALRLFTDWQSPCP
jgi:hypothetical protein